MCDPVQACELLVQLPSCPAAACVEALNMKGCANQLSMAAELHFSACHPSGTVFSGFWSSSESWISTVHLACTRGILCTEQGWDVTAPAAWLKKSCLKICSAEEIWLFVLASIQRSRRHLERRKELREKIQGLGLIAKICLKFKTLVTRHKFPKASALVVL